MFSHLFQQEPDMTHTRLFANPVWRDEYSATSQYCSGILFRFTQTRTQRLLADYKSTTSMFI
jgi:hypothetical protein